MPRWPKTDEPTGQALRLSSTDETAALPSAADLAYEGEEGQEFDIGGEGARLRFKGQTTYPGWENLTPAEIVKDPKTGNTYIVRGTNVPKIMLYETMTGGTSLVSAMDVEKYLAKRNRETGLPVFTRQPTAEWEAKRPRTIDCPVDTCQSPIVVQNRLNKGVLQKIGVVRPDQQAEDRRATMTHLKAFHKEDFANLIRQGYVTEQEAANL